MVGRKSELPSPNEYAVNSALPQVKALWAASTRMLEVTLLNDSVIPADTPLVLVMSGVFTPETATPQGEIIVTTFDKLAVRSTVPQSTRGGQIIDGPTAFAIPKIVPGCIEGAKRWSPFNCCPGAVSDVTLSFIVCGKVPTGGKLLVELPGGWDMDEQPKVLLRTPVYHNKPFTATWDRKQHTLEVCLGNGGKFIATKTKVILTIQRVKNPDKETLFSAVSAANDTSAAARLTTLSASGGVIDGPSKLEVARISELRESDFEIIIKVLDADAAENGTYKYGQDLRLACGRGHLELVREWVSRGCNPNAGDGAKVLAEVYRLHHVPLPPITLQALLKRGPKSSPAVAASLANDPQALSKWREVNAPAIVTSAQLLHREVPIRIARRIVDLENLPDELPNAKPIVSLREQLLDSFDRLMSCPLPANLATEHEFMELHRDIRKQHATMHGNIAEAVQALEYEPQGLSESLDNFYNSRIGIRMLVDQHIAAQTPTQGFTGIVADECSPVQIAQGIVNKVKPLWQESLKGEQLPEIRVNGDVGATYRYIPQHIEIVLTEVFKNAVINSVAAGASTPPPVTVLISGGPHGVCMKVSDLGGGMTRKKANALSNYYHTATSPSSSGYDPVADVLERRASGLDFSDSFGLRIAQLYAKYFGGELAIMPMEGHGVDTYIYMNCLTGASELK
ncbi:hypothetical protein BBJ29_002543 [Phytophthora kernoviae]|uniref:Protein-serine/threonine kinase n=1 Tax=Phytophthora kernoviae TaxID=325452 RepID=A0A3F2RZW0_9STRA|nr:hypothetical protein BBJ29_002543 [Phytophthora kernoviae]RLN67005.1 hypothetical protein BBP00_00001896 [Phytophthora kernoviae]